MGGIECDGCQEIISGFPLLWRTGKESALADGFSRGPIYTYIGPWTGSSRAQELCESREGRPGLLSLISLRFLWT